MDPFVVARFERAYLYELLERFGGEVPIFALTFLSIGQVDAGHPLLAETQAAAGEREDALRAKIEEIDPDALTPREALALLYELKDL